MGLVMTDVEAAFGVALNSEILLSLMQIDEVSLGSGLYIQGFNQRGMKKEGVRRAFDPKILIQKLGKKMQHSCMPLSNYFKGIYVGIYVCF